MEQMVDEASDRRPDGDGDSTPPMITRRRRRWLSLVIVVLLGSILVVVMPDSVIKSSLLPVVRPVLLVTGLDQRWGVFAPNPRLETSYVFARVERADGTVGEHAISDANGVAEYWDYRWRKYGEQLWADKENTAARREFAAWVLGQDRAEGHQPVRVILLRRTADNLPPGPGPDTGPWREVPFFTLSVGAP